MNDQTTTMAQLKQAVMDLCRKKGWGENGEQNPQNVAMAMTVEMAELLENFQWLEKEEVRRLWRGEDPERRGRIAEEFADVMMYGLQLMAVLKVDVAEEIEKKIRKVDGRPDHYYEDKRRMKDEFEKTMQA